MATTQQNEKWATVDFGFKYINNYRLQVSNLGNLKAFNKFFPNGEPLQGSAVNGYRIVRIKLYSPKNKKIAADLKAQKAAIVALRHSIKQWRLEDPKKNKNKIATGLKSLSDLTEVLKRARKEEVQNRTIYYHSLIHRLVADYFVSPKSAEHTIVGHIDHNKLNNKASNLKWMTPEENYMHQQLSPAVKRRKKARRGV